MQAAPIFRLKPKGNYVFIKGSPADPNADFLRCRPAGSAGARRSRTGDIKIVGESTPTAGTRRRAEEHGADPHQEQQQGRCGRAPRTTAWPAAWSRRCRRRACRAVPVSGQDGDHAALNRVALGTQTVSVWKDARPRPEAAAAARGRQEDDRHSRREPFTGSAEGIEGQWHSAAPLSRRT